MDYAYTYKPFDFFSTSPRFLDPPVNKNAPDMRPIYLPAKKKPDVNYQENGNVSPEEPEIVSNGEPKDDYRIAVSNLISKFETNLTPSPKKPSLMKSKSFSVRGSKKEPKINQTQDDALHNKTEAEVEEIRKLGVRDLRKKFEDMNNNTDNDNTSPERTPIKSEEKISALENVARLRLEHFKRLTKKWERTVGELLRYLTETSDFDIYNVRIQDLELSINRELLGIKVNPEDVAPQEYVTPQRKPPEIEALSHVAKITSLYEIKSKEKPEDQPRTPTHIPKRLPWTTGSREKKKEVEKQIEEDEKLEEAVVVDEIKQEVVVEEEPKFEKKEERPSNLVDTEHLKSASLITSYFNSLSNVNNRNNETSRLNSTKDKQTPSPPAEENGFGYLEQSSNNRKNEASLLNNTKDKQTPSPPAEENDFGYLEQSTNNRNNETSLLNSTKDNQTSSPSAEENGFGYLEQSSVLEPEDKSHNTSEHFNESNKPTQKNYYETISEPKEDESEQLDESNNPHDTTIDREFEKYYTADLKPTGSEERLFEDYYRENVLEDSIPEELDEEIRAEYEEEEQKSYSVVVEDDAADKDSIVHKAKVVEEDDVQHSKIQESSTVENEENGDTVTKTKDETKQDNSNTNANDNVKGYESKESAEENLENRVTKNIVIVDDFPQEVQKQKEIAVEELAAEDTISQCILEEPAAEKISIEEYAEQEEFIAEEAANQDLEVYKITEDAQEFKSTTSQNENSKPILDTPLTEEESTSQSNHKHFQKNLHEKAHVEEIAPVMRRHHDHQHPPEKEHPISIPVEESCLKKYIMDTSDFINHEKTTS